MTFFVPKKKKRNKNKKEFVCWNRNNYFNRFRFSSRLGVWFLNKYMSPGCEYSLDWDTIGHSHWTLGRAFRGLVGCDISSANNWLSTLTAGAEGQSDGSSNTWHLKAGLWEQSKACNEEKELMWYIIWQSSCAVFVNAVCLDFSLSPHSEWRASEKCLFLSAIWMAVRFCSYIQELILTCCCKTALRLRSFSLKHRRLIY